MDIQTLRPQTGARTASKRVGRGIGSGMGKTSTRGHKGQWARSGGGVRPNFEGGQMPMTRRLPKIGFNNKRFAHEYSAVNIDALNVFADGEEVGIKQLVDRGIVKKVGSYGLKILGNGELTKSLTVVADKFTASAAEKIVKAGGKAVLTGGTTEVQ